MARPALSKGTLLIIILGVVSLFADFVYEGARSIIPQYLTTLGGSVFMLGIVLGVSEFVGYAFRLISGKIADRTKGYWAMMFLGYAINLFAIPALALAGNYLTAAILVFLERFGKGTRAPPKDYVISTAASKGRVGRAFAISQALDQMGAIIGPISVVFILLYNGTYRTAFSYLLIPAVLAMVCLAIAYLYHGRARIRPHRPDRADLMSSRKFLLYSIAIAISAAGLYQVAFVLYGAQGQIHLAAIPIIYIVAMAGEGLFGFIFGLLYDRLGRNLVYSGIVISLFIPLMLVWGGAAFMFVAALIYGAVTGIQDTVMRAVVGTTVHPKHRGGAYGIFNAFYGFGLMVSGIVVGYLYHSIGSIIAYVFVVQIIAAVVLAISFRKD